MANEIKEYYDFIANVTREAGKIVVDGFYGSKTVETKGNLSYDLVTDCDKKVEEYFTSKINRYYPHHLIIGEESSSCGTSPKLTDSPTWIIDPIDGTMNFVHGIPMIGISVGLTIRKKLVLGIVYNPITNEFFSAIKGQGAFCNGKRIHSNKNEEFHKVIISNELSLASIPFLRERTLQRIRKLSEYGMFSFRCFGSAAITLCYLANGSVDVYFTDGLKCWDVAAGVLIVQEAGGCASSSDGKNFDLFAGDLLTAANEGLLKKMVEILKTCDEKTSQHGTKMNTSNSD